MQTLDEQANPRSSGSSDKPSADEVRSARERLGTDFNQVLAGLKRSIYIERQLLGLTVATTIVRGICIAAAASAGLAVAVAAGLLAIVGARRGVQLLTDDAWWGDILLAVGLLALLLASVHFTLRTIHRSVLAKTRRELGATDANGARRQAGSESAP